MEYTRTRGDAEAPHTGAPEWRKDRHGWWLYSESGNRRKGIVKECESCGKEFLVIYTDREKRRFCGRTCGAKHAGTNRHKVHARGEDNPNWKGGRHVRKRDGYVQVRITDEVGRRRYVFEHRHVMAQHLGRKLTAQETVHHKNGDTSDNRLENLELHSGRHGRGATEPHCATCSCFS